MESMPSESLDLLILGRSGEDLDSAASEDLKVKLLMMALTFGSSLTVTFYFNAASF